MRKLKDNYSLDILLERKNALQAKYYELTRTVDENIARELIPNEKEQELIDLIIEIPEFMTMTEHDKAMIWKFRYSNSLKNNGKALSKFLQSVRLENEKEREEAMRLAKNWSEMKLEDALPLLSAKFAANPSYNIQIENDPSLADVYNEIRAKAVRVLEKQTPKLLTSIML